MVMKNNEVALLRTEARHPQALSQGLNPNAALIEEEIALDLELGLPKQAEIDAQRLFSDDVKELTCLSSYQRVTPKVVEKMFGLGKVRWICALWNAQSAVGTVVKGFMPSLIGLGLATLASLATWRLALIAAPYRLGNAVIFLVVAFGVIGAAVGAIWAMVYSITEPFNRNGGNELKFRFIWPKLDIEQVENTSIRIPNGAKLALKKARETGIFDDFAVASPEITVTTPSIKYRPKPPDPVLLGVTKNLQYYLVAWWDIEKDVDRIQRDLRVLRKFRVK